jgi:acetylornithine deacetylase/succinyl-diaminopimelate desuccinylase-like protein
MHQTDERASIADIRSLTDIYAEFLGRWLAAA